jgi:hypothetical protein
MSMADELVVTGARLSGPPAQAASSDRRRPGRIGNVSPALIPLLRATTVPDDDGLAPARGIMVGLLLSMVLWATIGGAAWLVLR